MSRKRWPTRLGVADLHIHSDVEDGMASVESILEHVQERTLLDLIAVTDHDTLEGSLRARELSARGRYTFEVVVGTEVTTLEGHLLALFIEHPVPPHRPLAETTARVHEQGGICIAPHPMSWMTNSVTRSSLEGVMASSELGVHLDGVETLNPTLPGRVGRRAARAFQRRHRLAATGGSDAHFLGAVGSGVTLFEGRSAEALRRSIVERRTRTAEPFRIGLTDAELGRFARWWLWREVLLPGRFPLSLRYVARNLIPW